MITTNAAHPEARQAGKGPINMSTDLKVEIRTLRTDVQRVEISSRTRR